MLRQEDICCYFVMGEIRSDGGIMVSIAAFQAVDPGSIPGHRIFFRTDIYWTI